jgi:hypothetical protein
MFVAAAATQPEVGIPLGVLIGVVTGGVAILLFKTGWHETDLAGLLKIIGQLLAIPAFWFGGPWLTTNLLASVDLDQIRASYLMSLAIVFVPLAGFPVVMMSWRTGLNMGAQHAAAHEGDGHA